MVSLKHYPIFPGLPGYLYLLLFPPGWRKCLQVYVWKRFMSGHQDCSWCSARYSLAWSFTSTHFPICVMRLNFAPISSLQAASAFSCRQMWCHPYLQGKCLLPTLKYLITLKSGWGWIMVPIILKMGYKALFTTKVIISKPGIIEMPANIWLHHWFTKEVVVHCQVGWAVHFTRLQSMTSTLPYPQRNVVSFFLLKGCDCSQHRSN